jgi:hypothetical protein
MFLTYDSTGIRLSVIKIFVYPNFAFSILIETYIILIQQIKIDAIVFQDFVSPQDAVEDIDGLLLSNGSQV